MLRVGRLPCVAVAPASLLLICWLKVLPCTALERQDLPCTYLAHMSWKALLFLLLICSAGGISCGTCYAMNIGMVSNAEACLKCCAGSAALGGISSAINVFQFEDATLERAGLLQTYQSHTVPPFLVVASNDLNQVIPALSMVQQLLLQ